MFLRSGHALLNQVPRHYNNCCTYHTSKYVPGALFVRIVRRWFTYTWYGITTIIRISRIWKNWNIESKGTRGGSAKICEIQQKANYQESWNSQFFGEKKNRDKSARWKKNARKKRHKNLKKSGGETPSATALAVFSIRQNYDINQKQQLWNRRLGRNSALQGMCDTSNLQQELQRWWLKSIFRKKIRRQKKKKTFGYFRPSARYLLGINSTRIVKRSPQQQLLSQKRNPQLTPSHPDDYNTCTRYTLKRKRERPRSAAVWYIWSSYTYLTSWNVPGMQGVLSRDMQTTAVRTGIAGIAYQV